jgi:hypothetical protein
MSLKRSWASVRIRIRIWAAPKMVAPLPAIVPSFIILQVSRTIFRNIVLRLNYHKIIFRGTTKARASFDRHLTIPVCFRFRMRPECNTLISIWVKELSKLNGIRFPNIVLFHNLKANRNNPLQYANETAGHQANKSNVITTSDFDGTMKTIN